MLRNRLKAEKDFKFKIYFFSTEVFWNFSILFVFSKSSFKHRNLILCFACCVLLVGRCASLLSILAFTLGIMPPNFIKYQKKVFNVDSYFVSHFGPTSFSQIIWMFFISCLFFVIKLQTEQHDPFFYACRVLLVNRCASLLSFLVFTLNMPRNFIKYPKRFFNFPIYFFSTNDSNVFYISYLFFVIKLQNRTTWSLFVLVVSFWWIGVYRIFFLPWGPLRASCAATTFFLLPIWEYPPFQTLLLPLPTKFWL